MVIGFTIVEVIVAMVVLAIGVLGLAGTAAYIVRQVTLADIMTERAAALQTAVERIQAAEDARGKVRAMERALEERMNADRVGLFLMRDDATGLTRAPGSALSPDTALQVVRVVEQLRRDA